MLNTLPRGISPVSIHTKDAVRESFHSFYVEEINKSYSNTEKNILKDFTVDTDESVLATIYVCVLQE